VKAHRASDRDGVRAALAAALASSQPELVEVPVAPGMSLF
jgi:thiamine pyrophosphate-dependent acetolactate synthase large subunit-like protein